MYYVDQADQRFHWGIALAIAIAVHALVIVGVKLNTFDHSSDPAIKTIAVQIMSSAPKQVKAQTKPVEPQPIEKEIKPKEVVSTKKPVAKKTIAKSLPDKPKVKKVIKPEVTKPQVAPLEEASVVKALPVEPTAVAEISQQANLVKSEISTVEIDNLRASYLAKLRAWLLRHKHYPALAKRRKQQGVVSVKFTTDALGKLLSQQIVQASPYESLNEATMKMVQRAAPMPAVPVELRQGKQIFEYTIPVEFELLQHR